MMTTELARILAWRLWRRNGDRVALAVVVGLHVAHAWRQTVQRGWRIATFTHLAGAMLVLRLRPWRPRLLVAVAVVAIEFAEDTLLRRGTSERAGRARRTYRAQKTMMQIKWERAIGRLTATLMLPLVLRAALRQRDWAALHPQRIDTEWRKMARPGFGLSREEQAEAIDKNMDRLNDLMVDLNAVMKDRPGAPTKDVPRPADHGTKPGDDILNQLRREGDKAGL